MLSTGDFINLIICSATPPTKLIGNTSGYTHLENTNNIV
jgi:hypothetical protein